MRNALKDTEAGPSFFIRENSLTIILSEMRNYQHF
jgi:hypothetical protein